jgi:DNA-binding HxlR family transcriptional regulator
LEEIKFRSSCPLATGLDVLGDKWSLILVRNMLLYKQSTFKEFSELSETIATNILADRLKKLAVEGILEKTPSLTNKKVNYYTVTQKGIDTLPIIIELMHFAAEYYPKQLGVKQAKLTKDEILSNKPRYTKKIIKEYQKFKEMILLK